MELRYTVNEAISSAAFIDVLKRSSLAERRPIDDATCIAGMLEHGNLLVCAWDGALLVGVSRSVTDFHYACYLSDLAVDRAYQGQGIGLKLQQLTQRQLGPNCKLILLAAPAATGYYPRIGYSRHDSCWIVGSRGALGRPADPTLSR